ncbi:MAG: hypothetical protein IKV54_03740 [Clostridia bacterium]|nr:hypothetical protein [Clostridia bacterium]
MEINQSTVNKMLAMSDADLWRSIRLIASTSGIKLDNGPAPEAEMEKIRTALSSVTGSEVSEALKILSKYKK